MTLFSQRRDRTNDDDQRFLLDTDNTMALFVLTDGQSSYKFSLCWNILTTASFMTYSAYVYGTIPAAKGKRGAILLLNFVLLPSLASCNKKWGKMFLEAFDPFVSCWFPAQPLFRHALPFLVMWQSTIKITITITITITTITITITIPITII